MAQQRERMVRGTVEAVNERGVKLGGAWLNFSKFAEVARPDVGDEVEVVVKDDKWVQGLKAVGADGQVAEGDPFDDATSGAPEFSSGGGDGDDPSSWGYGSPGRGTAAPRRVAPAAPAVPTPKSGKASLRAAALSSAAHYLSAQDMTEEAVYAQAHRFLAWIESDD